MNLPSLATERLTLSLLAPGKDTAMCEFMATNAPHLAPWETLPPDGSDSLGRWRATCVRSAEEFASGQAVRLTAALHSAPETIIACINFTQISRGPFQACFLGYKIGQNQQGQGLMSEALRAATRYMFDVQDLHRIHANYMPHNVRSGRLLARLGFVIEGYARDYLLINGAWRDHVLTSLTQYRPTRSWTI